MATTRGLSGQRNPPADYSRPLPFNLAETKPNKTVDVGSNGTSVSTDPLGLLSAYHPEHGVIVAAPYEQFDGSKFREPLYVREYRRRMTDLILAGRPGFGLRLQDQYDGHVEILHQSLDSAIFRYTLGKDVSVTYTLHAADDGAVKQLAQLVNSGPSVQHVNFALDMSLSVHRASYGQLTEGGPIPIPKSENTFEVLPGGTSFRVVNPFLDAHVTGSFTYDGAPIDLNRLPKQTHPHAPVSVSAAKSVDLPAGETGPRLSKSSAVIQSLQPQSSTWKDAHTIESYIIRRNINYIIGNCSVPITETDIAIITDHVALPLGWNRDNYWQMRLLIKASASAEAILEHPSAVAHRAVFHRITKGHLHWVFRRAGRPHGYWHRSYLVTGRPKDGPVFQLDQQCYPFLELCDFADEFPDDLAFVASLLRESSAASEVLRLILSRRDAANGLFPTDETPGDDAVEHPYHFSSHVLLWYTITRLSRLLASLADVNKDTDLNDHDESSLISPEALADLASSIRAVALSHFLVPKHPATGLATLAYLTSGTGQHTFYHDANDIPTLFATAWSFLTTPFEVAAWHNTMAFALSSANKGGYYGPNSPQDLVSPTPASSHRSSDSNATSDSNNSTTATSSLSTSPPTETMTQSKPNDTIQVSATAAATSTTVFPIDSPHSFYGLGSVHSASPWPLGYFQEWVYASSTGDAAAEADAWRRICGAMQWDGTFCEAVEPGRGGCWSKCWFSWPGAMIAAELVDRAGRGARLEAAAKLVVGEGEAAVVVP